MGEPSTLRNAIEGLYELFAKYPLPADTRPCPCCHTLEDDASLRARPLRDIEPGRLRKYAYDALLVWGDVNVFKHFLPRIFELVATMPDATSQFADSEIVFSKFRHGKWRTWPREEQAAVERFLHALWERILNNPSPEESFTATESWLCAIGQCEDDLSPYLNQWMEDESLSACLELSSLLLSSAVARTGNRGRNGFWDSRDAQYAQLKAWATSTAVAEKLRLAEVRWSNSDVASTFAMARSIVSQ
jgi:hypothetical protein